MIYAVINRSFTGSRKPELEIGGAVRFNYNLSSWKEGQKNAEVILDMMSFVSMQSQVQRN
jgi:hypothetical protein